DLRSPAISSRTLDLKTTGIGSLSQRERGLTEVYLRFTLACNIEPNAGLENNRIDSLSLGRGLG
ncbi:hypothetical protein, partial [Pseudomonas sp. Sample_23]|uniref:hypothetical protein n=1 Tax=Pseudomonas sp. Sample_23 TaxID=2448267 RepID=UPI0019D689E5